MDNNLSNWEACLGSGCVKKKHLVTWSPPSPNVLKFNVDGAARGKPGPANIGGILRNYKGDVLFMFSNYIGIKDSNEVAVLAILEALRICVLNNFHSIVVESDSLNAIS